MTDDFEREERAFAEALHASVPKETFRPLDPAAIRAAARPARTRPQWVRYAAAAAVVVAVAGAATILPRLGTGAAAGSAPMAAKPEDAAAGGAASTSAADRNMSAASTSAEGTGGKAAEPGFRWESYRDVQVQVPETWGYAFAPQSDYCADEEHPTDAYVDLTRGTGPVRAILCTKPLADDQQAMHLSFTPVDGPLPWSQESTVWQSHTRDLGRARITVTAKAADTDLANRILASATVVPAGVDPNGCPTSLPDVAPSDLAGLQAGDLSVCLYEREQERGQFRSSTLLTGAAAERAWRAVLAAPGGGGPDADPKTCGTGEGWPLLLLVGPTKVPVAASMAGCAGNGVTDAGADRGSRSLTRGLCEALLVDPVRLSDGFGPAAELCVR